MNTNKKRLWLDTETLGFNRSQSDIIQLAGFIEIDNNVVEKFNYFMKPHVFNDDKIEPGIWEFHEKNLGVTRDEILSWQDPNKVVDAFMQKLLKYINPYNKNDKFIVCGYNVSFDIDKIVSWVKHFETETNQKDKYWIYSIFSSQRIDPMYLLPFIMPNMPQVSLNLGKVWERFRKIGIDLPDISDKAHDARTDVMMTYTLWKKIIKPVQDYIAEEFFE